MGRRSKQDALHTVLPIKAGTSPGTLLGHRTWPHPKLTISAWTRSDAHSTPVLSPLRYSILNDNNHESDNWTGLWLNLSQQPYFSEGNKVRRNLKLTQDNRLKARQKARRGDPSPIHLKFKRPSTSQHSLTTWSAPCWWHFFLPLPNLHASESSYSSSRLSEPKGNMWEAHVQIPPSLLPLLVILWNTNSPNPH